MSDEDRAIRWPARVLREHARATAAVPCWEHAANRFRPCFPPDRYCSPRVVRALLDRPRVEQ